MAVPPKSPFAPDHVEHLRVAVPATLHRVQLNAGTLGPWPEVTIAAMRAQLDHEAFDRQPAELWTGLGDLQTDVRALAARLTGAEPVQVALMHASHEALNACLWGLDLQAGDNIVTTDEEHPGLLVPLRIARDRRGVELRTAAFEPEPAAFIDGVLAKVDDRTRIVVVSHVSWRSGHVAPLRMLASALGEVPLVVDGAQGAGAMEVDIADGWAAYTVSGQKWSMGPNGSGALVLADPTRWQPTNGAFMTVADPEHPLASGYALDGRRFEMAQEAWLPLVGWRASLQFLLDEVGGIDGVRAHAHACNGWVREQLTSSGAFHTDQMTGNAHLLCLHAAGAAPQLAEALAAAGIIVRSVGDSVLRLSFGFWNDLEDLARACTTLEAARRSAG